MRDINWSVIGALISVSLIVVAWSAGGAGSPVVPRRADVERSDSWDGNTKGLAGTVVINEVYAVDDYLELYNDGPDPIDLYWWDLETTGCGTTSIVYHPLYSDVPLNPGDFILNPGEFVTLREGFGTSTGNTLYIGSHICWNAGLDGSIALKNSVDYHDFARWGGSLAVIPVNGDGVPLWYEAPRSMLPGPGPYDILGLGTEIPETPHSTDDWCLQPPSPGVFNGGCGGLFWDGFEPGSTSRWSSTAP